MFIFGLKAKHSLFPLNRSDLLTSSPPTTGEDLVRRPKLSVPRTNLNMVQQLCSLLEITLVDNPRMSDPAVLESLFIFCVVWSIGATVVQKVRAEGVGTDGGLACMLTFCL